MQITIMVKDEPKKDCVKFCQNASDCKTEITCVWRPIKSHTLDFDEAVLLLGRGMRGGMSNNLYEHFFKFFKTKKAFMSTNDKMAKSALQAILPKENR